MTNNRLCYTSNIWDPLTPSDNRQLNVAQLVTTPDRLRPYVVLYYSKFRSQLPAPPSILLGPIEYGAVSFMS